MDWSGAKPGDRCLDICCGSGDLALLLAATATSTGQVQAAHRVVGGCCWSATTQSSQVHLQVEALDFAPEMLDYARHRSAEQQRPGAEVSWVLGDALQLPFDSSSFDAVTMGYGLRNVADASAALREVRRVLKPGCKAAILDFNNSENPLVRTAQGLALDNIVVPAASQYGLRQEYAYLKTSIARFATGEVCLVGAAHSCYVLTHGQCCLQAKSRYGSLAAWASALPDTMS